MKHSGKGIVALIGLVVFGMVSAGCTKQEKTPADYVNLFIGTGGHGHTYPGVALPHGLVQLSPDTRISGWDACSGYHYDDTKLIGFSHTHLSGTGIGDYGDILFLPVTGNPQAILPNGEDQEPRFGSVFSHQGETAYPGYYSVVLESYNIKAELTATAHAGFHRYTFPTSEDAGLIIDLTTTMHNRHVATAQIKIISDTEIQGMKQVQGWAPNRFVFFYAKFSKPFTCKLEANGTIIENTKETEAKDLRAYLDFGATSKNEKILSKAGISFVDCEGAKNNVSQEITNWNFEEIVKNATAEWAKTLNKIAVKTNDEKAKTIFYTALYHASLEPTITSDVDGRYRTMDNQIARDENYTNYSVFSLWDTFRALHPLYTIITPVEDEAMIRSLLRKSDEGGLLPMWELASNYTGCMIGYHSVSVIVDAYMKGLNNFDVEKAYLACKKSSSYDTANVSPTIDRNILHDKLAPMSKYYKNTIGYIPADKEKQSVAKGLEYAYNDWLISQFAKALGNEADCKYYGELSKLYRNYYDPKTGFMRGKMSDGAWREPFDPTHSDHNNDDYCEGNAWQWLWFVPQDVEGLAHLMGGREALLVKLDSLFSISSDLAGENVSADISGMIGQYAHGNEPSHQTIHMYNVMGQPWKTQELVDQVLQTLYFNDPDGLSGNEDCGQMSAWYILNSMGFYSYCPGIPYYSIGRPLFDETTIYLDEGKSFTIRVINNSSVNKYIKSAKLNGKYLDVLFFSHKDLMQGGVLEIEMTDQANKI